MLLSFVIIHANSSCFGELIRQLLRSAYSECVLRQENSLEHPHSHTGRAGGLPHSRIIATKCLTVGFGFDLGFRNFGISDTTSNLGGIDLNGTPWTVGLRKNF
jgi:hypothetical protein